MSIRYLKWGFILAALACCIPDRVSATESAEARLHALESRLLVLEDKLAQSERLIEGQRDLLRQHSGPDVDQGHALNRFLSSLEVGGHVTTSYIYNFNSPDIRSGVTAQPLCQFNCRHNEFKLDAAKLEIGKAASKPGDAGFELDVLLGQNADILRGLSPTASGGAFGDDDFSLFVQQSYVSYNFEGVELKAGKFETLLGRELLDSNRNSNISHGVLFTWAIPLYHTGILASGAAGENSGWKIGMTNGFNNPIESNDSKGVVGAVSFEENGFSTSLSGYLGAERSEGAVGQPGSTDDLMIFDLVASYESPDGLLLWVNVDWGQQEDGAAGDDSPYWGIAVGAKTDLTDDLSLALRGEYFYDEDDVRGTAGGMGDGSDVQVWTLTGTLAYSVTENLTVRSELRYDHADNDLPGSVANGDGDIFPDDSGSGVNNSDFYGIVEASYVFD